MAAITTKPIIVPWDFSDMSHAALKKAAELADSTEQIHVVHVTSYPDAMEPSVIWGTYDEEKISSAIQKSFLESVNHGDYPGCKFHTLFGSPANEITLFAEQNDAGLIIISSHGRTGVPRLFMGSVAERVVRHAHCPVLVLRD